jgi:hypothetical protein
VNKWQELEHTLGWDNRDGQGHRPRSVRPILEFERSRCRTASLGECRRGENGSPLGDRKGLAAMVAPQVQVMVRDQDDGTSVLVAIEAGEPLENRLELPRSLTEEHAAILLKRSHSVWYTDGIYAHGARRATPLVSSLISRAGSGSASAEVAGSSSRAPLSAGPFRAHRIGLIPKPTRDLPQSSQPE